MGRAISSQSSDDASSHQDCNRSGSLDTVRPETGEVESNPCGGCGGNGIVASPTDRTWRR